jgi:hypothetical protein
LTIPNLLPFDRVDMACVAPVSTAMPAAIEAARTRVACDSAWSGTGAARVPLGADDHETRRSGYYPEQLSPTGMTMLLPPNCLAEDADDAGTARGTARKRNGFRVQ